MPSKLYVKRICQGSVQLNSMVYHRQQFGTVWLEDDVVRAQALFSQEEGALFVNHFKTMAELGYGYSRVEVVDQSSNYDVSLGKRDKDNP